MYVAHDNFYTHSTWPRACQKVGHSWSRRVVGRGGLPRERFSCVSRQNDQPLKFYRATAAVFFVAIKPNLLTSR